MFVAMLPGKLYDVVRFYLYIFFVLCTYGSLQSVFGKLFF